MTHNEYDAAGRLIKVTRNYVPSRPQNDQNQYNIITQYQYNAGGSQTAIIDTYGRTTQYGYNWSNGRLVSVVDPAGNQTSYNYTPTGLLANVTDPLGKVSAYEYDQAGQVLTVFDAHPQVKMRFTYNSDGTIATERDELNRVTSYAYDELKRVKQVTDPMGGVTSYEYDEAGNVISMTDPRGKTTYYEYDALNHLIKQTDPNGGITETFYDAAGNKIQTIDPRGKATTYTYDAANRLLTVTDARGGVTTYEYDDLGRRTAMIDARNNRTTYTYDLLDRLVATTDSLGHVTTNQYDAMGNTIAQTDANGFTTTYQYNNLYRLTSQTDPLNGVMSFVYDAVGNRTSVTDANNHTTTTGYDVLYRPITVIDPNNHTTTTAYDAVGNVLSITDPLGHATTFGYDALNRQTSASDGLNNVTQYGYDAVGNLISTTDANGIVTRFEYDSLNHLTAVVENYQSSGGTNVQTNVRTEFTYDKNGNRLTIKDGNGHTSNFTYDELNRLVQEADPLGNTWTYSYDAVGNRTSVTDANLAVTQYIYDAANQLTNINYSGSDPDVGFTYDNGGRRLTMTDGVGTTTWTYDNLNRPTAIQDPFGKTVGYGYDPVGNHTSLTYPGGSAVNYMYDNANRLTTVNSLSSTVNYTYDNADRLTGIARANGVNTAYTYDNANRLRALAHTSSGQNLALYQYVYDAVGNRTQAIENIQQPTTATGAQIDTFGGGAQQGSHFVDNNTSQRKSYAGVNAGPVKIVSTNNVPTVDSERVIYKVNGVDTSYSETMALSDSQLDTTFWFPWYNNVGLDTQLRFANVGDSTATLHVYIGGVEMTGSPFTLAPGASTRQSFAGINTGPVKIVSDVPIVAAQRVIYTVNGLQTSFSETMGLPDSQLDTTFWFPWYNNVGLDTQLRFANVSTSTATVRVYIGGVEMTGSPFTLAPGASTRQSFAGINSGPVKIVSDVPIVAAERVIYKVGGVETSYSEMMGLPDNQVSTTFWFPSYNNVELNSQLRFANVSSSTATVRIYVGGVEMTGNCTPSNSPFTLAAGESLRVSCSGVNSGPVKVVSDAPIVAAQNMIYKVNNDFTSYSEMMGLPDSQLDTTFWLPWYNNAGLLNTELILGSGFTPPQSSVSIDYEYDPLNRLTEANYSNNDYYHYTYDAVGNRLTQQNMVSGLSSTVNYAYDNANRLTSVNGVSYSWDNNGNLLNDGVNTYTYDSADRLKTFNGQGNNTTYSYNGLGDRLQETLNGNTTTFTMDLNTGLAQALSDGTSNYIYGVERIAQVSTTAESFLGDALGSVRQLTSNSGVVTYARAYDPYGVVTSTNGSSQSMYGYTGEYSDSYIKLIYLRSRWYDPASGRFNTKDSWQGDYNRPLSLNRWNYVEGNPINLTDHSGYSPKVDCTLWDWYFKPLCEKANGNDNDQSVLDAREQLFYAIAAGGYGQYWKSGGAYGSAEGYAWAANLLLHFLNGSGSHVNIYLGNNDPFVNDPYITRATKRFAPQSTDDEADVIVPLLYDFMWNYVKPAATADGNRFQAGPVKLYGSEHYFNSLGKEFGLEPRAYDRGYWAAFGHVTIDGSFSAYGNYHCSENRYLVTYIANYSIEDSYEFFENKETPFPFGLGGNIVKIPHEWERSLVTAGRAKNFKFTVSWKESERLLVAPDFTSWTNAPWWMWW